MTLLAALEALLACTWLGGYLFTQFVVTPALASLDVSDAERVRLRSTIGRRYGRLAAPFFVVWLAVLLAHGAALGFPLASWLRLGVVAVLALVTSLHGVVLGRRLQALAEREAGGGGASVARTRERLQRRSAQVTPVSLAVSLVLAAWSLLVLAGWAT